MIVNAIEPDHGKVLDPACGSGGMFVQSAHFIEKMKQDPTKVATFYGQEKNATTIRLAKMNLAVHGLEGKIEPGITYYTDAHELLGSADFVMANPPFNVDEVDAERIRKDPRLPFGLPGVNKGKKVSNGNYLWISYFYSYLKDTGRAGFVMSSQASSAGGEEAKVRQKLIETGHVDAMIAIRGNFFYTRTVPCELWLFDKAKPAGHADKVLMLDARAVFRKVTRKVYDFSPEQLQNLTSIFWLYRGQEARFRELLASVDPVAEARIAPGDRMRLSRAMEVLEATGRPLTAWQAKTAPALPADAWRAMVIEPERDRLYARCDARFETMLERGALDEVRALIARGLDPDLPVMKAVGVRELAAHLRGEISLAQAAELARRETRRYAKRQLTWLRNQTPDWPRITETDAEAAWGQFLAQSPTLTGLR
jgi:hypothetical protein